jgi:diguanylate cyclase (GGDEF)-like protein/PAS domain S-box-containing protein
LVNVEVSTSGLEVEGKSYIYAASRDITERKKAADRINELASFNNQIISGAPVGIFLFRADGQCVTANPAAARLSGIAQEILVTQNFRELDSWRKSGLLDIALAALADNQVKEDEVHHHTSYDQEFWAIFRFAPLVVNGARHLLMIATDISEHKRAENQIRELAFYDPLTHLPNRRLLMDRLKQAMAASLRNEREGALLFVDLDNFKTVNDTLGHDKGDLLLQEVARRLTACFREADTVARIGGDEFVVVLANLSDDSEEAAGQARIVGEKVLAILGEPYQILGNEFRCTPSVGIALFGDQSGGLDELMKQADIAMYQAKAAGRHALRFFDPDLQTAIKARAEMEDDLRQGIEAGQLLLYYQPQVDDRGAWTGAEALVRWRHPLRGLVSPGEFIGLAEDTGLILPLGNWVLETACLQTVAWAKKPEMAHLTLAVNVSARQFHQADFVASVLAMVERTGADPRRLKLELTESTLLDNVQDIIDKMETLKARGFTFSLDDFGTGYSSLAYLKRLPLDQLKIDQSFVRDVLVDSNDAAIAETIVALAQSLKLNVIAEGVETRAQKDFLAAIGCHAYQGYFFGHPMPLEDFELSAAALIPS